jgi:multiple sugar transport system permease protein
MPPSFLPPSLDFKNYAAVLHSSVPFLQIYRNSIEVAVLVTLGQLITCTLAAFAFARLKFPGRDSIFFVMLIGLMFPAQVTIIPIYLGFAKVGLLNHPIGLALMYLTSSFGVFLVRQFMRSQPRASGNLSVVMAAISMAVLPVILIFLLAQKMVIEGVAMSGIKH